MIPRRLNVLCRASLILETLRVFLLVFVDDFLEPFVNVPGVFG